MAVEFGSSAPKNCHAPLAWKFVAKNTNALCTAVSPIVTPVPISASTASAVVSLSMSAAVLSPAKPQPPFACCAALIVVTLASGAPAHSNCCAMTR